MWGIVLHLHTSESWDDAMIRKFDIRVGYKVCRYAFFLRVPETDGNQSMPDCPYQFHFAPLSLSKTQSTFERQQEITFS